MLRRSEGLQLWHSWPCPYCKRVRAALAEKGVPYRSRLIQPGEKPTELLGLQSRGMVPVLVDGDRVIAESWTILEHLEERWPEPPLFPAPPGRDAVKATYDRVNQLLAPLLPRILRGTPEERTEALHELRGAFIELDIGASETGYLLGPFSAADLALASFVARLPDDWRPAAMGFERLGLWERTVFARPAVRDQLSPRVEVAG
jgi:RNA polymerase-associated protein